MEELTIMTFNIRYDTWIDIFYPWRSRKQKVTEIILSYHCHVVGIQEALPNQMKDLRKYLPNYDFVGVDRQGNNKGEYTPIFYDFKRLKVLESNTFWLSERPEQIGKKGWDALIPRIVTWAKFRDNITQKVFYFFNTHFANRGTIAKNESAKLLREKVAQIGGNTPCIISGDFNSTHGEQPIEILTDKSYKNHFINSKNVSLTPHFGPHGTFNDFKHPSTSTDPIDFIFIRNGVAVKTHGTIDQTGNKKFPSDHFPVITTIIIN